jgi:hypothetical protein
VRKSLRELMADVVDRLDSSEEDAFLDADDAVQVDDAYGGRVSPDRFEFVYLGDPANRWVFALRERQVRDVAEGHLEVVSAEREALSVRAPGPDRGDPLLVWGDTAADALLVREIEDARAALAALAARAVNAPRWFRLWSRRDDLMFGVILAGECALEIVWSDKRFATSHGDDAQSETFDAPNVQGGRRKIPWSKCIDWNTALRAALDFARTGEVGSLPIEARIDGDVLKRAGRGRGSEPSLV